jgi:hypothetical protein
MITLKTLVGACVIDLPAAASLTTPPPYSLSIGIESARAVMAAAKNEASGTNWSVVINSIDSGGNVVMLNRHNDVQLSSTEIAQDEVEAALMFKWPSIDGLKPKPLTFRSWCS